MSIGICSSNSGQRSPFMYGTIFSYSVDPRAELPSIGRFLSQGAAMGALLGFLWPVVGILSDPENGYIYLLVVYLPLFLFGGILFGLCAAVPIWAFSFLLGHRLHLVVRAAIGAVTLPVLIFVYFFIFFEPSPYDKEVSTADYLRAVGIYAGCGALCGLVIGSRFQPVRELIRGTKSEQWPVMNAFTGFALRIVVLLAFMFSALILLLDLPPDPEFMRAALVFGHFAGAAVILFVRMPFWLLLPLALIVNFPLAAFVPYEYESGKVADWTLRLNYFGLWSAFLLCRWSVPRAFMRQDPR